MTEIWEQQQLPRSEIDKMRKDVKQTSEAMDEVRRTLIDKENLCVDRQKK